MSNDSSQGLNRINLRQIDPDAEMLILLNGLHTLTEANFIL